MHIGPGDFLQTAAINLLVHFYRFSENLEKEFFFFLKNGGLPTQRHSKGWGTKRSVHPANIYFSFLVWELEGTCNRVPLDFQSQQLVKLRVDPFPSDGWMLAVLAQRKLGLRCGSWVSKPAITHPELSQGWPVLPVPFNVYTL